MPSLSGSLDFLLGLLCLAIAVAAARRSNFFLVAGFLLVAAAALVGGFSLGGVEALAGAHDWLSKLASGPGMFLMGLGILAAVYGPFAVSRLAAPALVVAGAALVAVLHDWSGLNLLNLLLGTLVLVALLLLAVQAFRQEQLGPAVCACAAIGTLLIVGFALPALRLPKDALIQRVDVLHVLLMLSYTLIWFGVAGLAHRPSPAALAA